MPQDLRTYLDQLLATHPDQFKVVDAEVDPVFEATAIVDKMQNDSKYPG
ncbi:MAG: UbiD family decarboxylase, partial [Chloroflexi bacterium]|nr:UbiD family decarboxylase [Chloroflexota bacterium]